MKRVLCFLGIHRLPLGVKRKWSWTFHCLRCGGYFYGDLGR